MASKQIEALAALQELDQSLRENTITVEASQRRLAEAEESVRTLGESAAAAREALAVLESRQRDLEQRLTATEAKLKDKRMRIARIRNDKELGLARREVDILTEEKGGLETELVSVLEQVETAGAARDEAEARLAAATGERDAIASEARDTIARLGEQITAERSRRDALVLGVDDDLRRRYEMIFSRRNGVAVVAVREGTCQGCRMRVPPQLFNQIQRNEQVILCPSCQRMLFWRPEREEEAGR